MNQEKIALLIKIEIKIIASIKKLLLLAVANLNIQLKNKINFYKCKINLNIKLVIIKCKVEIKDTKFIREGINRYNIILIVAQNLKV